MKAKVLKDFNDKYTGRRYKAGEIISVSKERFDEILTVDNLIEAAEEVVEEKTASSAVPEPSKEKTKKTTRKATTKTAK